MTLALQLFKNSINTQEKLRLNLHSLSVSVSELLEYGRYSQYLFLTFLRINLQMCFENLQPIRMPATVGLQFIFDLHITSLTSC
jgi:hypothetical protein